MHTIVFDDRGRPWDARSQVLRAAVHCPTPDFDFISYVVDNLGFVVLSETRPGALRIRFRPVLVAQAALAAGLFALADRNPERVVLSRPADGCCDELFASVGSAINRIGQLTAAAAVDVTSQFLNEGRRIEDLAVNKHPLAALLSLWVEQNQIYDPADHAEMLNGALGGRFMTVTPAVGHLAMAEIGSGFLSYNEQWRRNSVGRPLEDQPDYAYGLWARDMFRNVLHEGRPRLDDIDAVIRRPHFGDKVRLRYRCLILPYRRVASASPLLLCASVINDAIDLRSGGANQSEADPGCRPKRTVDWMIASSGRRRRVRPRSGRR